jgi:hypothetical protein
MSGKDYNESVNKGFKLRTSVTPQLKKYVPLSKTVNG